MRSMGGVGSVDQVGLVDKVGPVDRVGTEVLAGERAIISHKQHACARCSHSNQIFHVVFCLRARDRRTAPSAVGPDTAIEWPGCRNDPRCLIYGPTLTNKQGVSGRRSVAPLDHRNEEIIGK